MLQRWEYKIIEQSREVERALLNEYWSDWEPEIDYDALGQKGWELVSVVPISDTGTATESLRHYFKRPA